MTRLKALGVVIVFIGTVTALRAYEIFQEGGMNALDIFLLLSQTNAYAVYVIMLGVATKTYPYPLLFLFLATAVAEFGVLLIAIPEFARLDVARVPASAWGAVLFAGWGSSVFAHSLNSWAVARVKGVLPTVYSGVQVIFTIVLSRLFLRERLPWDRGVGIAVTILGVCCVARAKYAESPDAMRRDAVVDDARAASCDA